MRTCIYIKYIKLNDSRRLAAAGEQKGTVGGMLSAIKNFAITFLVSAVIFGVIAYFVSGSLQKGFSASGKPGGDDPIGASTDDTAESPEYKIVTDASGNVVTDVNGAPVTEIIESDNPSDIKGESFNVLLVGTDYQPNVLKDYDLDELNSTIPGFKVKERTVNADTIILVRVDKEKEEFIFLPIPSNTQVDMSGVNTTLSALYSKYGLQTLCQRVRALTGLDIDYYVSVSIPNLASAIDAIGGISFMVPTDMNYIDESQSLNINIPKGQRTLDGNTALQMLRYCSYNDGNLSRMALGIDFVKAVFEKMTAPAYLGKAATIYNSVVSYSDTNLTIEALMANLDLIFEYPSYDKVDLSYPGVSKTENGIFYFIPSYKEAIKTLRIYR